MIKRFQSLRRIFNAVLHSIIPVANALFIAIMVIAIYTIIGVFLFAEDTIKVLTPQPLARKSPCSDDGCRDA